MTERAISESISIDLPSHPQVVRVIRTMANRTADLAGLGYDRVEDLGLAIDEAAAMLLELPAGTSLSTALTAQDGEVGFVMSRAMAADEWPPPGWAESIGGLVLDSVASNLAFSSDEQTSSIHISILR